MKRLLLFCAVLLPVALHAQNQLVPAPDAVKLRRVWTQKGKELTGDEYGKNVWGGIDITGDSIADFAVYRGSTNEWQIYEGGNPPSSVPFLIFDSLGSTLPVVGDFRGDGRLSIGFIRGRIDDPDVMPKVFHMPFLYEVKPGGGLDTIPWAVGEHRCFIDMRSAELDGEPGDEMVIMRGCSVKEIWIYKGGPDFQLDTPTVIISDTGLSGSPENWQVRFADFDGDGRTDMVMGGDYPGVGDMLRFYWGDENSPRSWAERDPDRDLPLVNGQTGMRAVSNVGFFQLDAHPGADIVGYTGNEAPGTYVYLSSHGNPRDRSFLTDDADVVYASAGFSTTGVGYMNDSLGRYEMLPMSATISGNQIGRALVSGSSLGPDHDYEAWYAPGLDGLENVFIFQRGAAVGDVTGDGFGEMLYADYTYGPFVNTGIAFLLSGGPDIPFDDLSVIVEEYPVAGESTGLYLWPNPVDDELHIAWKGNLKRMPTRFEVYDMNGAVVVQGEVDTHRGEAVWQCAGVAAGTYLLVAYDRENNRIADARIIKR